MCIRDRANMYAHLLSGKGSFLRIEGTINHRFQAYYIDQDDIKLMVNKVTQEYIKQNSGSNLYSAIVSDEADYGAVEANISDDNSYSKVYKPIASDDINLPNMLNMTEYTAIGFYRPLTEDEVKYVRSISTQDEYKHLGQISINKLAKHIYGSNCPKRSEAIKLALADNKIIKLRKVGT